MNYRSVFLATTILIGKKSSTSCLIARHLDEKSRDCEQRIVDISETQIMIEQLNNFTCISNSSSYMLWFNFNLSGRRTRHLDACALETLNWLITNFKQELGSNSLSFSQWYMTRCSVNTLIENMARIFCKANQSRIRLADLFSSFVMKSKKYNRLFFRKKSITSCQKIASCNIGFNKQIFLAILHNIHTLCKSTLLRKTLFLL
jgi:hypothetical protein